MVEGVGESWLAPSLEKTGNPVSIVGAEQETETFCCGFIQGRQTYKIKHSGSNSALIIFGASLISV
jgi:hypothetical protein